MAGKLYLVATPIGNLEDITLRAVRVLSEAAWVAAEDTRRSARLLNHLGIKKPLISLHEHNEETRGAMLMEKLSAGEDIALITDAGTPAVCDPGAKLVRRCMESGIECVPVPGPCALAAALSASGADAETFAFEGFLPSKGSRRAERVQKLLGEERAVVLYEAPHRLLKTFSELYETLGEREIIVLRELTKLHEQILRCRLSEAAGLFPAPKGEFVIIIEPKPPEPKGEGDEDAAREYMDALIKSGEKRGRAAALVAEKYGIPRSRAYGFAKDAGG